MKKLLQLADEIGVTKQAVYKRYSGKLYEKCKDHVFMEYNALVFDEAAEQIIKQDFIDNPSDSERIRSGRDTDAVCDELRNENLKLRLDIAERDKKIAVMEAQLDAVNILADSLKDDKTDLQRHRDVLTNALSVSKSDLARLENILTQMAALPLGTRIFKWSGAVKALTDTITGEGSAQVVPEESIVDADLQTSDEMSAREE